MPETQVRRTERVTIAMSKPELAAVQLVAETRKTDEGPLFRDLSLRGILAEARRLRAVMRKRAGK